MIRRVEMTNWRAYDQQNVSFGPGLTFIVGANGSGKTSILEAIGYGLTGEPSVVEDRALLLRRETELATVRLEVELDGQAYCIERSQSAKKAEQAYLSLSGDRQALASSHKRVTAKIEELSGVSADFLRRIVYMAEGDVARFLQKPPTEALKGQIRQVLGITQIDELLASVQLAQKGLDTRAKDLTAQLSKLEELGIREEESFGERLGALQEQRQAALADLRQAQGAISRHQTENEHLLRLLPLLDRLQRTFGLVWPAAPKPDRERWEKPVRDLLANLEQELAESKAKAIEAQQALARLEGELGAVRRVQEVIEAYRCSDDAVPCPVCGKPMYAAERQRAVENVQRSIERLAELSKAREAEVRQWAERQRHLEAAAVAAREANSFIEHSSLATLDREAPLPSLYEAAAERTAGYESERAVLEARARDKEKALSAAEAELAAFAGAVAWLRRQGYATREQAIDQLVAIEVRLLSLRAAAQAAQRVLAQQQNADLTPLLGQIAALWSAFAGEADWKVELDPRAMPVLSDAQDRRFDISQLSGGEKTALMVILHTLIAHHFSSIRFLLIDEPLEHLDPVNRRSLIRFLVDAAHQRLFDQAIVTTFEESLIRRYLSDKLVQVIHI